MTIVTEDWIGGEPRVTINRSGDQAIIKLLGSRRKTGTKRLNLSNLSDTPAKDQAITPYSDTEQILAIAISMAKSAGSKCWIWDACQCGAAKLHQERNKNDQTDAHFFDDKINF